MKGRERERECVPTSRLRTNYVSIAIIVLPSAFIALQRHQKRKKIVQYLFLYLHRRGSVNVLRRFFPCLYCIQNRRQMTQIIPIVNIVLLNTSERKKKQRFKWMLYWSARKQCNAITDKGKKQRIMYISML